VRYFRLQGRVGYRYQYSYAELHELHAGDDGGRGLWHVQNVRTKDNATMFLALMK
jgi:hypothetical protein